MKKSRLILLNLVLILIFFASSCKFRKFDKSDDWRVKYEAGLNYYEEEDYYRASVLFEQIMPIVRGLPEGEQVQFYLANCNYHQNMYLLAAHHFKTFYEAYGRSSLVQEARYMHAYALYSSSPEPHLDQSSSIEAITAMQNFVNRYPKSEFYEEANNIIGELQLKLEQKGFDNAFQYYKLRIYTSAVTALENFRLEYPGSELNEKADYYKLISQYKYANNSIISKQPERFNKVKDFYEEFIERYPDSDYIKDVEELYIDSSEKLDKFARK